MSVLRVFRFGFGLGFPEVRSSGSGSVFRINRTETVEKPKLSIHGLPKPASPPWPTAHEMNEIYTCLQIINLILSFLLLTLTTPRTDQPATAAVSPSCVAGRCGRAWPGGARMGGASAHGRAAHGWVARGRAARVRVAGRREAGRRKRAGPGSRCGRQVSARGQTTGTTA